MVSLLQIYCFTTSEIILKIGRYLTKLYDMKRRVLFLWTTR